MQSEPGTNDILNVALLVGSALDAVGAKYMVVGSVASSLIGNPRTTNDIDIVTVLGASQVRAFREALGADFDVDEKSLSDAMASGGSWSIFFVPWMLKVDIFAADSSEFQRSKFSPRSGFSSIKNRWPCSVAKTSCSASWSGSGMATGPPINSGAASWEFSASTALGWTWLI